MPRNPVTGHDMPGARKGGSQRGALVGVTREAIAYKEDFVTNGALWGQNTQHNGVGEFTVYSYREPIAVWQARTGWVLTKVKFSNTTGRHQSMVRQAIHGTEYAKIDKRFGWTA